MIRALVEAIRPAQWTKNLLVFAGVLFSQQLDRSDLALRAVTGFLAFSLLAGATYLVNDLKDLEYDRLHPRKQQRAIASGRLPVSMAWAALVPLLAVVALLALGLGRDFVLVAGTYLTLNLAYTFALKEQVLVDVFVISIGFVLRAIAGVELLRPVAPDTELSPWLLVCTFFGALFLALAKRRRELANAGQQASRQRAVLRHYGPELLDGLLHISAAASLMSYALYTIWPGTVAKFGSEVMLYTVPFVAYGIFRYLYLVRVAENTDDPSHVLLTDRPLAACVGLYLACVLAILYWT